MARTDDLIAKLLADHEHVKHMFSQIESAPPQQVGDLFWSLTNDLVRHEVAEEELLYPRVRKVLPDGDRLADERIKEQSEAEQLLADMEKGGTEDPRFAANLTSLHKAVLEHATHEETTIFAPLSQVLDQNERERLGGLYDKAKATAPTHPHPTAPDTPPGNMALGPIAALVDRTRDAFHKLAS